MLTCISTLQKVNKGGELVPERVIVRRRALADLLPDIDVEEVQVRRQIHLSTSAELPLRLTWLALLFRSPGAQGCEGSPSCSEGPWSTNFSMALEKRLGLPGTRGRAAVIPVKSIAFWSTLSNAGFTASPLA